MKKILPIIIVLVIIIAALVGWKFMGKGKKTTNQGNNQQTTQQETKSESFTGKIKDAFMKGIPLKCAYKKDDQNYSTGYLKDKKYYAEVVSAGKLGYMILVDNCLWAWNKEGTQDGVKMCFAQQENEDMWSSFEQNQKTADFDYNCAPTIVNEAVFTPPADIKFINIDELMNQATQGGEE